MAKRNDTEFTVHSNSTKHFEVGGVKWFTAVLGRPLYFAVLFYCLMWMIRYNASKEKSSREKKTNEDKLPRKLRRSIIVAIILGIGGCIFSVIAMIQDFAGTGYCFITKRIEMIFLTGYWAGIFLSIWIRQRVIYRSPVMKTFTTKVTRILSIVSVAFVFIFPILTSILFFINISFEKCIPYSKLPHLMILFWCIPFFTRLSIDTLLFALFYLPLSKKEKIKGLSGSNNSRQIAVLLQKLTLTMKIYFCLDFGLAIVMFTLGRFKWFDIETVIHFVAVIGLVSNLNAFPEFRSHFNSCCMTNSLRSNLKKVAPSITNATASSDIKHTTIKTLPGE